MIYIYILYYFLKDNMATYTQHLKNVYRLDTVALVIILATKEAEMERITVQGQSRQKVHETPISTND
jgi:hypothetical protein